MTSATARRMTIDRKARTVGARPAGAHARSLLRLANRGVERLTGVDALRLVALIVRHAHSHRAAAASAAAIAGREVDGVDAAVACPGPLGAEGGGGRAEAEGVGAGLAVAQLVGRLVLSDRVDGDGHRIAVRIGHAVDADIDELAVRRIDGGDRRAG